MWPNESPSLPDWIEDAYNIILGGLDDHEEGFAYEEAYQLLLDHEAFPDQRTDAEYVVDRLLNNGWFYDVDGELYITEIDD